MPSRPEDRSPGGGFDDLSASTLSLAGEEAQKQLRRPNPDGPAKPLVKPRHQPFPISPSLVIQVHAGLGIALYAEDGNRSQNLLRHGDQALYRIKANMSDRHRNWPLYGDYLRIAVRSSI